jgi:nucleotide-binding universal stress UspA family protein
MVKPMRTLRQLVAGTDFSECAEQAVSLCIELALAAVPSAGVTLVHVCEQGVDDVDEAHLRRCEEELAHAVARHRQAGVAVSFVLRSGQPWTKLDNVAAEVGARLIVIGRHGSGRSPERDIGSVAARLSRSASRPVLIAPCEFTRLEHEANPNNQ